MKTNNSYTMNVETANFTLIGDVSMENSGFMVILNKFDTYDSLSSVPIDMDLESKIINFKVLMTLDGEILYESTLR